MFSVLDISLIYTFTVFMCFVIFYLSLSLLALMHFYHMFLACSISSFSYVYHIFISYMTFMVIYYTICYVLCSCTVFMYSVHILFSCYTFILLSLDFHMLFIYFISCPLHLTSCTCILVILSRVLDTLLLVLVYLSYFHRIAVL